MKKIISLIVCAVMMSNIFSVNIFAASETVYQKQIVCFPNYESYQSIETLSEIVDLAKLEETLFNGLYNCESSIDISSFGISNTQKNNEALRNFIYEEMPECFHINSYTLWTCSSDIIKIDPNYSVSKTEYKQMYSELCSAKDELLMNIKNNDQLTDVEKALLIHDRLALICEYDFGNTEHKYTCYGAMVEGTAVCQGYTEAYDYLLEEVGIESYTCSSDALNHIWNIIYIDDVPYHVDVTWDDIAWDTGMRGVSGGVSHDNFLRSSSGIYSAGHNAADYDTFPNATTYDNYFWQNSETAFQLIDNELYYIDNQTEELKRYSDKVALSSVDDSWYYWSGNYTRLSSDGRYLYYSLSDAVYRYDISARTTESIFQPEMSGSNRIYGFEYSDGYLICDINIAPPYSDYYSGLYQIKAAYNGKIPSATISSTNNVSSEQTVTIDISAENGIAGYYWGTSNIYSNNTYIPTSSSSVTLQVTDSGVYFLTVKDAEDNLSKTESIRFYKTALNGNGGTVAPSCVLTAEGNSFTLPNALKSGYYCKGWSKSASATTGIKSLTPSENATYYAVFDENLVTSIAIETEPTKKNYYIGDLLNTSGLKLSATRTDGSTETITSGFTTYGFNSTSAGQKTVTVLYEGKTATFNVTVSVPSITLSSGSKDMFVDDISTVTATTVPGGQPIPWTSSDARVAVVSNGTVTAKAVGKTTITASFMYNGTIYSKTCAVTVKPAILRYLSYTTNELGVVITDCDDSYSGDLIIPSVIEELPVVSVGEAAFFGCGSITSVTVPSSVISIGQKAFYECTELAEINILGKVSDIGGEAFFKTALYENEENWKNGALYISGHLIRANNISGQFIVEAGTYSIADSAFYNCKQMDSVVIPEGVIRLGDYAFNGCTSLKRVTFSKSVKRLDDAVFNNCSSLTDVYYEGLAADRNSIFVSVFNDNFMNAVWHYHYGIECEEHSFDSNADTGCNVCGAYAYPGGNTLIKEGNTWYHIVDRAKVTDTTLVNYNGVWYYVKDGKVDFSATTLVKYNNKWWYVKAGKMARDNTLVKFNGTWYHVNNGNTTTATTLVTYSGSQYYVKNGKMATTANGLTKIGNDWYNLSGGRVVKSTTLVKFNNVWYYVQNGVMNKSNTLVKFNNVWYHVNGGKMVKDTTLVNYGGTWYYVQSGVMNKSNTLIKYNGAWYHVNGGRWVKDTTLVKYGNTWYYVKGGKVDFTFTGKVLYGGKYYNVKKGLKV